MILPHKAYAILGYMQGDNNCSGYTIVEVMIYLAVTGVLFVIAFTTIGGRQAQASFTQSIRTFQSRITNNLNDVSTGFYPNTNNLNCSLNGAVMGSKVSFISGVSTPGTNIDCTFIGKVLQFNNNSSTFNLITVVGTRLDSNGNEVSNLVDSHPLAAVKNSVSPPVDLTVADTLDSGVRITDLITLSSGVIIHNRGAVGFFTSFPQSNSSSVSGSLNTNVVYIPGTTLTSGLANTVAHVNLLDTSIPLDSSFSLNPVIVICLEDGNTGGNNRTAALIINNGGRSNTVELHIGDEASAVSAALGGTTCP